MMEDNRLLKRITSKLFQPATDTRRKQVALVLGSGGARGMAHIGVIEALIDLNFEIRSIAGCSFGAVVGGIYATGNLQKYKEWLLSLDKFDVFGLMDLTLSTQGFIKGDNGPQIHRMYAQIILHASIPFAPAPFTRPDRPP